MVERNPKIQIRILHQVRKTDYSLRWEAANRAELRPAPGIGPNHFRLDHTHDPHKGVRRIAQHIGWSINPDMNVHTPQVCKCWKEHVSMLISIQRV